MNLTLDWRLFALGSAFFAALTAIFGKLGVAKVNSDLATFIRTVIIVVILSLLVTLRGEWEPINRLPLRSVVFLYCRPVCYQKVSLMAI